MLKCNHKEAKGGIVQWKSKCGSFIKGAEMKLNIDLNWIYTNDGQMGRPDVWRRKKTVKKPRRWYVLYRFRRLRGIKKFKSRI